ncbi:uncharacterized protein LOC127863578 isoform X3 [Dreissena polymorpha]|nr:uncharacterized protein LOC127863578 isoform X3 [Dreissena polymorpha]XP_052259100.1 uncharacterized protein LOC127863578 isoform X3 [Dreissena polymorpha]
MADISMSLAIGSDEIKDFICLSCKEQANADFYCKTCLKLYCGKCIQLHDKWFKKHSAYGRNDMKEWPVSKQVEEFLLKCEAHKDEQIEMLCDDHSQLCCTKCAFLNHSQCSKVTLISEMINTQPTDILGLLVELETFLGEIKSLQISQELSVQSLQGAYKEHKAFVKKQMLVDINTTIDECGNSFVSTSGKNEPYLKEEMCWSVLSILNEFDNITVKVLNEMKDEVISIKGSIKSSIDKCTGLHNDLSLFHEFVQKIRDNKELCLIASIKCKHIIQQASALLGKSGKVFYVQGHYEHNVRIASDSDSCVNTGICVLPDGQVLVADWSNKTVKLLNQQYQVVSHCSVTAEPREMCQITPSEVAVAVDKWGNTHEAQFITVAQSQLVLGRKLQLQHRCKGIAHHHGDLFICSDTALYKYSLSGKLVCRLYEDVSGADTVWKCAVSPTGDKLYISSPFHHKLLTLARDGTVLATFTDPALERPYGLHVTPAGHVLVCGWRSHTIVQVDYEGRRKLATLSTRERDGVWYPESVCYSSTTSTIIVGQWGGNNILVFRVQ